MLNGILIVVATLLTPTQSQDTSLASSSCATVLHYNPEMITTKACVSRGDYKWTKKQISELGSPEQLITAILMLVSIWMLHLAHKTLPPGYFWTRLRRLLNASDKDLMEDLILAIRINMFLKEMAVERDKRNVFK